MAVMEAKARALDPRLKNATSLVVGWLGVQAPLNRLRPPVDWAMETAVPPGSCALVRPGLSFPLPRPGLSPPLPLSCPKPPRPPSVRLLMGTRRMATRRNSQFGSFGSSEEVTELSLSGRTAVTTWSGLRWCGFGTTPSARPPRTRWRTLDPSLM